MFVWLQGYIWVCVCVDVIDGRSQVGFLSTKLKQGRSLRTFSRRNSMQNTDGKKKNSECYQSNFLKQIWQVDWKCFKWRFNLVPSSPGSGAIRINCPSLFFGSSTRLICGVRTRYLWRLVPCLALPVGFSRGVWRGYCLQLSLLMLCCRASGRRANGVWWIQRLW